MAIVRRAFSLVEGDVPPTEKKPAVHAQLTAAACRWLRLSLSKGGHGCKVVVPEAWATQSGEKPDAIGWRFAGHYDGSVLVEAKASRADFHADADKPFRLEPATGVGRWRYFICPEGMIEPEEVPPGWGLLWTDKLYRVRAVVGAVLAYSLPRTQDWRADAERRHGYFNGFAFEERAIEVELQMLSKVVQRTSDHAKVLQQLRTLQNHANAGWREVDRLRAELRSLTDRYWTLRGQQEELAHG